MVSRSLDALRIAPSAPTFGAVLAALVDRLDAFLDRWMDGVEMIPGDMDSTLLLFFRDQQDEDATLYRIRR